jgi:hypothetical protein
MGAAVMRCSSRSHLSHKFLCTPIARAICVWERPNQSRASLTVRLFIEQINLFGCQIIADRESIHVILRGHPKIAVTVVHNANTGVVAVIEFFVRGSN